MGSIYYEAPATMPPGALTEPGLYYLQPNKNVRMYLVDHSISSLCFPTSSLYWNDVAKCNEQMQPRAPSKSPSYFAAPAPKFSLSTLHGPAPTEKIYDACI